MSEGPWVFGSGTGVLGRIGPIRLPFAVIGYHLVREIVESSSLHCLPNAGTGRLQETYEYIEERLLWRAGKGRVNLVGHSQSAIHYLRFAAQHPEKVGIVLSLGGPYSGSRLAERWPLSLVPCSVDLRPGSPYLTEVRGEYQGMVGVRSARKRPTVICYAMPGDTWVVDPWSSSLMPGAINRVLSHREPDRLPHRATWQPTQEEHNHFDVIMSKEVLSILARDARSLGRPPRRSQPVGVSDRSLRKAA